MKSLLVSLVVLACLVAVAIAQRAYYIPRLPDRVAAHIGLSGEVDQWQDREEAVAGSAQGWLVVPSIFAGIALLSVLAVRFLPYPFVNLPNKDYWLATPRRRGRAVVVVLVFFLGFLGTGVAAGVAITEEFVRASFSGRSPGFGVPIMVGILVAVAAQIVWLVVRLSRPREARGRGRAEDAEPGAADGGGR